MTNLRQSVAPPRAQATGGIGQRSDRVVVVVINFVRRHLVVFSAAIVALLVAGAWLVFGYFGIHTLFIDNEVDEALPTFETAQRGSVDELTPPADAVSPDPTVEPEIEVSPPVVESSDAEPPGTVVGDTGSNGDQPQVTTEAIGSFGSLGRYTTVGTALVLGDGSGQRFLRFEEFETSNGPDLNVYLVNSSTGDVSDFVDLGDLRGNIGNQNYEIPTTVDLAVYDTVMIWCVRFGTGFGQAMLALT